MKLPCLSPRPAALLLLALLALPLASRAEPALDHFRGKRLTIIVPTKPGGGYDDYARLIARHLPRHLPVAGVVVKNVPGAGHLVGARKLYAAKPDGLTLGTLNSGLLYDQLRGDGDSGLDLRRLSWIGKAAAEPRVLVAARQSGIVSVADLRAAGGRFHIASSGRNTAASLEAVMISKVLGLPLTPVPGFEGSEGELAMMRGDVRGMLGTYSSLRSFVEQGHGRILFFVGQRPEGLAAGIPSLAELARDDDGRAVSELIGRQAGLGRLFAAPPQVPVPILAVLRQAYLDTLSDPRLRSEAATQRLPLDPADGATVAATVAQLLAAGPRLRPLLPVSGSRQ